MLKIDEIPIHQILSHIEAKRDEMIETGQYEGLTDDKTIKCSKELDKLILFYQLYMSKPSSFT